MASDIENQIVELKAIYGEVFWVKEGGNTFYLLKNVLLPRGCVPAESDLLLCAGPRDGYSCRLFFAQQVRAREGRNWNGGVHLFDRTWHAFSWQFEDNGLTLVQKVSTHLRALE